MGYEEYKLCDPGGSLLITSRRLQRSRTRYFDRIGRQVQIRIDDGQELALTENTSSHCSSIQEILAVLMATKHCSSLPSSHATTQRNSESQPKCLCPSLFLSILPNPLL